MIGRITFWSNLKGFGFIVGTDQGQYLFCHHTALMEGRCIERGAMVSYEVGEYRGHRVATNVRRIGSEGALNAPAVNQGRTNASK